MEEKMKRRIDLTEELLRIFDTLPKEKVEALANIIQEYVEEKVSETRDDLIDQIEKRGIYDPDY
jgi:hypothetical protein